MTESNIAFVVAAYSVTWVALLSYLFRLFRKDKLAREAMARVSHEAEGRQK